MEVVLSVFSTTYLWLIKLVVSESQTLIGLQNDRIVKTKAYYTSYNNIIYMVRCSEACDVI